MFVSKLLFCVSVLSSSQIIFALAERSCFDCVSIASCGSGINFARKLRSGDLPPKSRQTFLNAMCGFDDSDQRIVKVCCSDFDNAFESRFGVTDPTVPPMVDRTVPPMVDRTVPPTVDPTVQPTVDPTVQPVDPIENHRNIGLLPSSCGDIDGSRIINGEAAMLYEFPWMTLISYKTGDGLAFNCAGSIINSRYILTAAHCVTDNGKLKNIAGVRVGDYDYDTKTDCQGDYETQICESKIQDILVEEIIPHPRFTGKTQDGADIALLRVMKAINMTNNVAPVCLPVYSNLRNSELAGKYGTVAGWGLTETGSYSSILKKVSFPILTGDACSHYYNRYRNQRTSITETAFCAGTATKDSCRGDSGGPLMVESEYNRSLRLVEFGIVSFGRENCGTGFPGVYTDVTKYVEWILDNVRE